VDLVTPPRGWPFGPIEVTDDLGETIYVPFRALFPPDPADAYEALHADADADALRAVLRGPSACPPIHARHGGLNESTQHHVARWARKHGEE